MGEIPRLRDSAVMVTGGCGFIGSHLVRALLARSVRRVVVIDSLRYGDRANLSAEGDGIEIVRHTLGTDDPARLAEAMRGVTYLFHLAAEKHNQSKDDPQAVFRSNIEGTYTLFDLAARNGVEKILFTSSLYAYGRTSGPPFVEDELPRPRTIYGISKLCGEHVLAHVAAAHGIAYTVLRYLFVYGPRQFAGMGYRSVIVKNFERLRQNQPPIVFGDGTQALDFVFVDDAVAATLLALETPVSGEVFNVGSGIPVTINELVAAMQRVAGRALPVQYEPPDWTGGSTRVGDVQKAARRLGWRAKTPLHVGLERTFRWMEDAR